MKMQRHHELLIDKARSSTGRSYRRSSLLIVLMAISISLYFIFAPSTLLYLGWAYLGGGSELQKIHPGTYCLFGMFLIACLIEPKFFAAVWAATSQRAFLFFICAFIATSAYAIGKKGDSIAPFIDTFAAAIIVLLCMVRFPMKTLNAFRGFLHIFFTFNVGIIFVEYLTKAPLFPAINGADRMYYTEMFRPQGLFGHPLNAAELIGVYGLVLLTGKPFDRSIESTIKFLTIGACVLSIFVTGSRAALAAFVFIGTVRILFGTEKAFRTGKINSMSIVYVYFGIAGFCLLAPILYNYGIFDLLLQRVDNDRGSALSRELAFQTIRDLPTNQLLFGVPIGRAFALAKNYGVIAFEVSWVNFILECGLLLTALMFLGYCAFLFRVLRKYCSSGCLSVAFFTLVTTSASNGIWSKTLVLSATIAISVSFLRKDIEKKRAIVAIR